MNEQLSESPQQDAFMQTIDEARIVAQAKPPAYDQARSTTGDVEYISVTGGPKITIRSEFDPNSDKSRLNAQTAKQAGDVEKHYTARLINAQYPDGENIAIAPSVEIHGKRADGTEYTRTSKSPDRARALGGIIAREVVDKLKNR